MKKYDVTKINSVRKKKNTLNKWLFKMYVFFLKKDKKSEMTLFDLFFTRHVNKLKSVTYSETE